jgi:hypothetical protein
MSHSLGQNLGICAERDPDIDWYALAMFSGHSFEVLDGLM